jgi:hypothetical protein
MHSVPCLEGVCLFGHGHVRHCGRRPLLDFESVIFNKRKIGTAWLQQPDSVQLWHCAHEQLIIKGQLARTDTYLGHVLMPPTSVSRTRYSVLNNIRNAY